jgi:hypothetical protein
VPVAAGRRGFLGRYGWCCRFWRGRNEVWAEDDKGKRRLLLRDSVILDDESGDLEDTMSDEDEIENENTSYSTTHTGLERPRQNWKFQSSPREVRPCVTQSRTQRLLRSVPFAVASSPKCNQRAPRSNARKRPPLRHEPAIPRRQHRPPSSPLLVRPCVTQSRTQRLLRSVPFAVASTVKVWTWA